MENISACHDISITMTIFWDAVQVVYHQWKSLLFLNDVELHGSHAKLGFDGGVTIDLESYDAEFDTTVILETEFHENNNSFVSQPDKHKRDWKNRFHNECKLCTYTN